MTKLKGKYCPICSSSTKCGHRCNWCWEELVHPWPSYYIDDKGREIQNINPKTQNKLPIEKDTRNRHYGCMKYPPADPDLLYLWHGKATKTPEAEQDQDTTMAQDLAAYMKNMLRLGNDGWWHGWRDGKYVGRVEKAPPEAYASWEPEVINQK